MSRIGKKPIEIPQGVEVKIEGQVVTAKGPLGTEVVNVRPEIAVKIEDNHVILSKVGTSRETDALFGLSTPITNFFDNTMVMIDDEALKLNRLSLLADIASKTSEVADFTKILTK